MKDLWVGALPRRRLLVEVSGAHRHTARLVTRARGGGLCVYGYDGGEGENTGKREELERR